MKLDIRRAEIKDAKQIHDFEIELQKEMHDLYLHSKLKDFAITNLRNEKVYTVKDYQKWLSDGIKKKDIDLNNIWYVAEVDGKVVGDVYGEIQDHKGMTINKRGYLSTIYVMKDYRKKGIASALSKKIIDWFKKKKINYIHLNLDMINKPASALYKSLGFIQTEKTMKLKL